MQQTNARQSEIAKHKPHSSRPTAPETNASRTEGARFPLWSEHRRKMLESLPVAEYAPRARLVDPEAITKIRQIREALKTREGENR